MANELIITRPDDMHLHVRDGEALASVIRYSAERFARAIIMPNLIPPVTTVAQAVAYRERIITCLEPGIAFEPLMTLYLTDNTPGAEIKLAYENEYVHALKYYPAGATTNSDSGVTDISKTYTVLEKMTDAGIPLLLHGEVTSQDVDIFDREKRFIDDILIPLTENFPGLRIVFEHITTEQAVQFVNQGPDNLAATITPQHLMYNRNEMLAGGVRPHNYCLPVLKREPHRLALVKAATSGSRRFFLGTDSAPHARQAKENSSGCAGIFSAPAAIEFYAGIFESAGALEQLQAFASENGADFYGLPRNRDKLRLVKREWKVPETLPYADDVIVPMHAGNRCQWQLDTNE